MDQFEAGFTQILGFHRLSLRLHSADYDRAVEEAEQSLDPENYDMGDVYYAAELKVGAGYVEFRQHLGLMILIRSIALAELTIARIADELLPDGISVARPKGFLWRRDDARNFFQTALAVPFDLNSLGMNEVSALRNHYAHGYGVISSAAEAAALEARLRRVVGEHAATPDEVALGFEDELHMFGGAPRLNWEFNPEIHLSALVVERLLHAVEQTVQGAFQAAQWGLKEGDDLINSRFVRDWVRRHEGQ